MFVSEFVFVYIFFRRIIPADFLMLFYKIYIGVNA